MRTCSRATRSGGCASSSRTRPTARSGAGFATCCISPFDGLIGAETRHESAELAGLEASLEVDPGDGPVPYRAVQIEQANEPDAERRGLLEEARNRVLAERLNPLHLASLERSHELCRAFGWSSYAAAYAELRGVDLEALARQTARFLDATEERYAELLEPPARGGRAAGARRASTVRPAAVLSRRGPRCAVSGGAPGRVVQVDSRRARRRPRSGRATSTSTPSRGGRSRRGHSARRLACPPRCTW